MSETMTLPPPQADRIFSIQIILWDFRQKVALTKCCGHEAPVSDVKFYPLVGKKRYPLLLSSGDYSVRMWHPLASSKELLKLKQHTFGNEVSLDR
jgi:WD40 repeat protein